MNVAATAIGPGLRAWLRARAVDVSTVEQRTRAVILVYLGLGTLGLIGYFAATDRLSAAGYLLVSLLPVVALIAGPMLHRPTTLRPWLLLGAGEALFFAGDVLWFSDSLVGANPFPSGADLLYLAGYVLLGAGLIQFIAHRRPGMRLTPLIDAFAIGMTGALVLWATHVEYFIHDETLALGERVLLLAYPIGDVLLLGFAAYLLVAGRVQSLAHRLLIAAFALLLIGDTSYLEMLSAGGAIPTDSAWLVSYLLIGLAALVPSMRSFSEPLRGALSIDGRVGLVALCVLLAAVPIFAVANHELTGHTDLLVVLVAEVVLAALIVLRAREYAIKQRVSENRFSQLLAQISSVLTVIDRSGSVAYVSPAIPSVLGYSAADLMGQPASHFLDLIHPADRGPAAQRLDRIQTGQSRTETAEIRFRHAGGAYRWLRMTATDKRDDPAIDGIIYSYDDVTAAHLAGDRLRFQATILENMRESVIVTDLEGRITYWGQGASEVFGYSAEEMTGETIQRLYPDESPPAPADLERILAGVDYNGQWRGRRRDGEEVVVSVRTSVMRDPEDRPVGFVGIARDVTEHVRANDSLRRLETAISQASEAVVITDARAIIEYVNPAFERITGYSSAEALGKTPRLLKSGAQSDAFYAAMWSTLGSGQPWVADFDNRRKDGTIYQSEAVISPIRGPQGDVTGFVGVSRDVSESRRLEIAAQRAARERALIGETIRGIDGRGSAEEITQAVCRQVVSLTDVVTSGLFVFELDGRAAPYGFALESGGDGPRRRVPKRRTEYLRQQALRGPWIEAWHDIPGHPYSDLFRTLGVRAIAYAPVRDQEDVIGFLHVSSASDEAEEQLSEALPALLEFADIAGTLIGHQVAERTAAHVERQRIAAIIEETAFFPVFQALTDLATGKIVGYEALTRFDDGAAPDIRFAEAGAIGMGAELELAAIRVAIDQAATLRPELWLNLNASPDLILGGGLAAVIRECDRELVLEVTEHSEITDYATFRRAIQELGPRVRLAVDDAGSGFASLRHILELRPAFVKLDREIIAGLDQDDARQALVAGLRHFARNTGCWLIAEGVETKAELETLRGLGIDYVQGYLFGRPAPVHRLNQ